MMHCLGVVPFDRARADTHAKPDIPNYACLSFKVESN